MSSRPTTATEQHFGKLIFIAYVFAEHVVVIDLGRDPLFAQFALHLHEFLNAVAILLHQGDEMVDELVFALVGLAALDGDRTDAAVTNDDAAARDTVNERSEESPVDDCRHADGEAHEQNPHPRRRDIGYDVRLT